MQPEGLPNYEVPPLTILEPATTPPDVPNDHGVSQQPDDKLIDIETDHEENDIVVEYMDTYDASIIDLFYV